MGSLWLGWQVCFVIDGQTMVFVWSRALVSDIACRDDDDYVWFVYGWLDGDGCL